MKLRRATVQFPIAFCLIFVVGRITAERRSQEKCREYGKLVFANEATPVLRINAGNRMVPKCASDHTPLIVGGSKASPHEFPHMAVIGYGGPDSKSTSWLCGGSVISENYILTAGHCLVSSDLGPATKVRVGLTNLKNPEVEMQERKIVARIKHPEYELPAKYNDIALLRLDEPLELGAEVRPACLQVDDDSLDTTAIATGFGSTEYGDSEGSEQLMKVTLNYVTAEKCSMLFSADLGGKNLPRGLIASQLCAGVPEGGKDTCQGDSGGPLQRALDDPFCTFSIVGVTSFGKFCGFQNSPGVYTKVSSYLDWIESIVWP